MDIFAYGASVNTAKQIIEAALDGHGVIAGKNIERIELTSTNGREKTYTVYLEDDYVAGTFTVTDGEKGDTGDTGATGPRGPVGPSGGGATINDSESSSEFVYSSAKVESMLDDIREIAEGKTATYVVSYEDMENLNSQNNSVTVSEITDINGDTIALSSLKVGDIVLVTEQDVPDRWVGSVSSSGAALYKLESVKVDLTNYLLRSDISTEIWDFTLENGETIRRNVVIMNGN